MHGAALRIAEKGKLVFPCKPAPDKSPLTRRGFKDATTDPAKINAYWNRHPGASIGVPAGKQSGFWVLDVDRLEALEELERRHGKLPVTLIVRTPSGGLHIYLQFVEGITNRPGRLPKGIDVRGAGGYVLLPPSPGYTVEVKAEIASAPEWLLKLIQAEDRPPARPRSPQRRRPVRRGSGIAAGEPIPQTVRNLSLFSFALDLRYQGLSAEEVLDDLLAINAERCKPPLDTSEVRKIAASACRPEYARRKKMLSSEALEMITAIEEAWLATAWKGVGGLTEASVLRALLVMAKRHGELIPAGIRVSLSVRDLALLAACNLSTLSRKNGVTNRLRRKGWIRKDDDNRAGTEAGAFVLLARQGAYTQTRASSKGVESVCASSRPSVADSATRRYRWRGLVNKSRERTLVVLEAIGPQTAEELRTRLGWRRARDLRLRRLEPLEKLGLIERRGDLWALVEDYEDAQEKVKQMPYSTVRRYLKRSRTLEGRMLTEVVESGRVASEAQREEWDRQRYERERQAFREDWEAGLIAPGQRYASRRRERAVEREMEKSGAVVVEFDSAEAEDLERIVDDVIEDSRAVFAMAKELFEPAMCR